MADRPLILITNDDGIESPGLQAAADAAIDLGDLLVVAPATRQTAMSRASTSGPGVGTIREVALDVSGRAVQAYAVTGSPAMAVLHAVLELADRRPALCISGINYGENIGGAIGISGTIGAAMEANNQGMLSVAASLQADLSEWHTFSDRDWVAATHFTRLLAAQVLRAGLPANVGVVSLNIPASATIETQVRRTVQSRQSYYRHPRPDRTERDQPLQLGIEISYDLDTLEADCDIRAVLVDKVVSVTPLAWSMTAATDWKPAF